MSGGLVPKVVFFSSLVALLYVYLGYPALIALWGRLRPRPVAGGCAEPAVSILIAAHNEERHIGATIRNKLEQDYPREKLEIIVISDGSTDRTEEIVGGFTAQGGVRLLRQNPRNGKTAALNLAAAQARGELIVFSDANSLYDRQAVRFLAENFRDPSVGYVTGKMVYTDESGSTIGEGCSAYMRYENWLRDQETRVGSIVGVDGGVDAVRASLFAPMRPDQLPDLVLPLKVVEQGYRVVYEPRAVLKEPALNRTQDEYRMRTRVSLRALWALRDMRHLMNPMRFPGYAVQLISHKYLRYHAFVLLALLFAVNLVLLGEGIVYRLALLGQLALYLGALVCHILVRQGRAPAILWPIYYFALVNVAAAHAFLKYLRGEKQVVWNPRTG